MKGFEFNLKILRYIGMKANYSELSRQYGVSRQTISKYDKGFNKKGTKSKVSILDKYKDEIEEKLSIPGTTITGVYKYFFNKDNTIGSRSNFDYYVRKHKLKDKKKILCHPRFETEPGNQLQFDFKENIKMTSRSGKEFKFNIFTTTLGFSRMHKFTYTKSKTKEDVIRCLIESFEFYGGVPKELLTDNMSSIKNPVTKKIDTEFSQFSKDFNFKLKTCKIKSPETKGKVESANRFLNRLIPYNNEFDTEEELISIIEMINKDVNNEKNQTTQLRPIMLWEAERQLLEPLPSSDIVDTYLNDVKPVKVNKDSLIYYKGNRYSVSHAYIDKTVKVRESEGKLYIYYNKELIRIHSLSEVKINYKKSDYIEMFKERLKFKDDEEMEDIALKNLKLLNELKG